MTPAGTAPLGGPLRPLALGEILDRAVTLCVRYFVPLSLIFIVYAVPLGFVQFYAGQDFTHVMQALARALQTPSGKPPDPQQVAGSLGAVHTNGWYGVFMLLAFGVAPLPSAALIYATTQAYLGRPASFGGAYRVALGRWLPLVGVNGVYAVALAVAYFVLALVLVLVIAGVALLTVAARGFGIVVALVAGFGGLGAMLAFFVVAALAFQVSYFTCVVEGANVRQAVSRGVSRVFGGIGLRRSLLVGLVFVLLGLGIVVVSGIGEVLVAGVTHSAVAGSVYATLVRVATAAFTTAFIAIFYFDLRVREEGFDLQLAAQNAPLVAPPA